MQINTALNLVFPIRSRMEEHQDPNNEGRTKTVIVPLLWAYHVPISTDVFNANYRIIAATKSAIFSKGVAYAAEVGPRIASLTLKDAGRADAVELGGEDSATAFLNEIKRLTHVLAPGKAGFDLLPIDIAISQNVIDREEWSEAESSLVFFTSGYAMTQRLSRETFGSALAGILRGSMTSLPPMEFADSLTTSTQGETSGAMAPSSPQS